MSIITLPTDGVYKFLTAASLAAIVYLGSFEAITLLSYYEKKFDIASTKDPLVAKSDYLKGQIMDLEFFLPDSLKNGIKYRISNSDTQLYSNVDNHYYLTQSIGSKYKNTIDSLNALYYGKAIVDNQINTHEVNLVALKNSINRQSCYTKTSICVVSIVFLFSLWKWHKKEHQN
ncbi:MAG TPA: hypothetical protein VK174_02080 [Chitinophagales bacterium]|nr:hypothetical protein [Chitinophagales bacterium]